MKPTCISTRFVPRVLRQMFNLVLTQSPPDSLYPPPEYGPWLHQMPPYQNMIWARRQNKTRALPVFTSTNEIWPPAVCKKHVVQGVSTFLTLPHLRGQNVSQPSVLVFFWLTCLMRSWQNCDLVDEILEKICTPSGNHKQALFASSRLEEDLLPPSLRLNNILPLGGDGEQGGDPPLLGHHLSHAAIFHGCCHWPFSFKDWNNVFVFFYGIWSEFLNLHVPIHHWGIHEEYSTFGSEMFQFTQLKPPSLPPRWGWGGKFSLLDFLLRSTMGLQSPPAPESTDSNEVDVYQVFRLKTRNNLTFYNHTHHGDLVRVLAMGR